MKNSTSHKIAFFVFLIVMLVLTSFKLEARSKIPLLAESSVVLDKGNFKPAVAIAAEGNETAVDSPTAKAATNISGSSFQANWSAVKGVVGYKLYVYTQGARFPYNKTYVSGFNPKALSGGTTIKSTVSGLNMNTTYYFALIAVEVDGKGTIDSDLSNEISVTTSVVVPEAPVATAATDITTTSFHANWEACDGADEYELTVIAGIPGVVGLHEPVVGYDGKIVTGTSFALPESTLMPGQNYYFNVKATNSIGTSPKSNDISVVTIPAPPVALAATNITTTSFQVNWEASNGASSYKLYLLGELQAQPGSFSHITGYNGKEVTGTHFVVPENTLEQGVRHYYFVRAINSSGMSSESNNIVTTTLEPMTYVPDDNFEQALIDLGHDVLPLDDSVPTANINALTSLDVTSKSIADLTGIEDFVALEKLSCGFNELTYLNVSANTVLEELYCNFNQLTGLNVKNGNNANFEGFAATDNLSLSCIEVDDAAWSTIHWTSIDATARFSKDCNAPTTYVPDDNFEQALIDAGHDDVLDNYVITANINMLTSLNVNNKSITDLTGIEDFIALTELACYNNSLLSLDLSQNTALEELDCESNQLENLDISKNTALKYLSCENNELLSLDISQNIVLEELECFENKLTSLDISKNIVLDELECFENKLTSLDLSKNPALAYLDCEDNKLTSLDVSQNPTLTYLDCAENQLSSLNIKNGNNSNLTTFNSVDNPNLTCIEVDNPTLAATYPDWEKDATANYSTDCDALAAPENLETTEIVDYSFVAKWALVSGATEYRLSVYTKNAAGDKVYLNGYKPSIKGATTQKALVEGLNPNTTYYWNVQAANASQISEVSETQMVKTKHIGTSILEVTDITSTSCLASWSPVAGALEYKLWVLDERDDYVIGFGPKSVSETSLLIDGLSPNGDYYIAVSVVYIDGESAKSWNWKITTSKYNLALSASPEVGGIVSVRNDVDNPDNTIAQATANDGYVFVNWTEGGTEVSTNATYSFPLNADRTLVANFVASVTTSTLSLSAAPVAGGTVTGGGSVNTGTSVIAQATANTGYEFVNWTEGGTEVSTNASYTFALNDDRTLVANFAVVITTNTLTLSAAPVAGGTVSGTATVNTGTSVTAQATANTGYEFVNWTEGGVEVSTNASYTFTLNDDQTLVANFAVVITTNTLTLSAAPLAGGTVNGAATVNTGTSVTAQATVNDGYVFVNWTEGGTEVSTELSYTFELNTERTLVANFQLATGIDDKNITSIEVWPNPASTVVYISEIPLGSSLKVTSLLGQVVIQKNDCDKLESLNVELLKNGIYILIIENKEMPYSRKFIKR